MVVLRGGVESVYTTACSAAPFDPTLPNQLAHHLRVTAPCRHVDRENRIPSAPGQLRVRFR